MLHYIQLCNTTKFKMLDWNMSWLNLFTYFSYIDLIITNSSLINAKEIRLAWYLRVSEDIRWNSLIETQVTDVNYKFNDIILLWTVIKAVYKVNSISKYRTK